MTAPREADGGGEAHPERRSQTSEVGSAHEPHDAHPEARDAAGEAPADELLPGLERGTGESPSRAVPDDDADADEGEDPAAPGPSESALDRLEVAEFEVALESVPEPVRAAVAAVIAQAISHSESWSGLLPRPDSFQKYPEHVQERMMRWNDSFTSDESKRQDKLVDAEIEQARKGPNRALLIVLVGMALAAWAGIGQGNIALAGIFMGAPVLMFAVNLIQTTRSKSSRPENGDAASDDQ